MHSVQNNISRPLLKLDRKKSSGMSLYIGGNFQSQRSILTKDRGSSARTIVSTNPSPQLPIITHHNFFQPLIDVKIINTVKNDSYSRSLQNLTFGNDDQIKNDDLGSVHSNVINAEDTSKFENTDELKVLSSSQRKQQQYAKMN